MMLFSSKVMKFICSLTYYVFVLAPAIFSDQQDPCTPSPCGPNSLCRDLRGIPSCSCQPNFEGTPPNCRPQCTINEECPSNLACINQKCVDPCPGSCGINAICQVTKHISVCACMDDFTGNAFTQCNPMPPPGNFFIFRIMIS